MKLRSLKLSGVAMYEDEVELDFDEMGPGVFAVVGDNGVGKTFLVDCMSAGPLYRQLPSKDPSPIEHYTSAGGSLELEFDLADVPCKVKHSFGSTAKAVLKVGDKEATSGKKKEFDQAVNNLIGPYSVFAASAYGSQGGEGGFDALSKADRKRLFSYILGLDQLEEKRKKVLEKLNWPGFQEAKNLRESVATREERIEKLAVEVEEVVAQIAEYKPALDEKRKLVKETRDYLSVLPLIGVTESRLERSKSELSRVKGDLDSLAPPDDAPDATELREVLEAVNDKLQEIAASKAELGRAKAALDKVDGEVKRATRSMEIILSVPCMGDRECFDNCQFLSDARAAEKKLPTLRQKRDNLFMVMDGLESELEDAGEWADLKSQTSHEIRKAERASAAVKTFEKEKQQLEWQYAKLQEEVKTASGELEKLLGELEATGVELDDDDIAAAHRAHDDVEALEGIVGDLEQRKARLAGQLEAVIEQRDSEQERLDDMEQAVADEEALRLLNYALGSKGLQVMEIDAAGPVVTGYINDLLKASFGDRFSVEITTLSEKKDGTLKEDFDFRVIDSTAESEYGFGSLSGGIKAVIGEAVRVGLAIFQAERSGTSYETLFRDEPGAALSQANMRRYVSMLYRAMELGGFNQVFFVTHSEHAPEIVDGVLRVLEGGKVRVQKRQ